MTGNFPPTASDTDRVAYDGAHPSQPVPDFALRGAMPTVMRLSRKSVLILSLVATSAISAALLFALRPTHHDAGPNLVESDARGAAEIITSAPKDYSQVPKLGPPLPGDLGGPILAAQQRGERVDLPPVGSTAAPPAANAPDTLGQQARQERETARTSSLFLRDGGIANAAQPDPIPVMAGSGLETGSNSAPTAPTPQQAFLQASRRAPISLERMTPLASPATLQAGSIIPAALLTGIRSDLPGTITAQVTQNVYDSVTGKILLIPQGSRLIGDYDAGISQGQNRVLLAWDRLIFPDGRSILLDRLVGSDASGYSGLDDRVNRHWGNVAKAALLSTILAIGTETGSGSDDALTRALRRGAQNSVTRTGEQIVERELAVPPTLNIRPGMPLRVIVARDIVFDQQTAGATR
ncbi:TraB/TrbI/VirB10 family type IV secretion system protein [Sphingobium xenophagum]